MKILHRQIMISHLSSLGMTLLVFTFVLLLGNAFKELFALMAQRSVGLGAMLRFLPLLMPYVLSFSMPMALLAATLLVIGRISADNELTACRASGIGLFQVILPILGVAAVLSAASFCVNHFVAPQTKYLFNKAFIDMMLEQPVSLLEEKKWIDDFPGMDLFIQKRDVRRKRLEGVKVVMKESNRLTEDISAEWAEVTSDPKQFKLWITLYNVRMDQRDPADPERQQWNRSFEKYPPIQLDLTKLIDPRRAQQEVHHRTSLQLWKEILELEERGGAGHPTPHLLELHKRTALATASIAFVLIGLPLGIQAQRRETSVGIVISLVLAVLYYLLILLAESFKKNPDLYPELIIWIPNLIFEGIGLYLLWRRAKV